MEVGGAPGPVATPDRHIPSAIATHCRLDREKRSSPNGRSSVATALLLPAPEIDCTVSLPPTAVKINFEPKASKVPT